jgi:hypothetical protein
VVSSAQGVSPAQLPARAGWAPAWTFLHCAVPLLAVCFVLGYLSLLLGDSFRYRVVVSEDGVFQNTGAVAFLASSVFFVVAYFKVRRLIFIVLAFAFFVGAGEELAWGQHLLNAEPPNAIKAVNAQDELTLHNLNVLQGGESGERNPVELLFFIFGIAFTAAAPIVASLSERASRRLRKHVPVVPWVFGALFLGNYALSKLVEVLADEGKAHAIVEIKEVNYALLFLAISFHAARRR